MRRPGCVHNDGPYHDCQYVDTRNRLISKADQLAYQRYHSLSEEEKRGTNWSRMFIEAMDELYQGLGSN